MSFTITIGGREAIPVRAVPFITGWEMSPDRVAAVLALDDFIFQTIRGEPIALTAYHLVDGKPHRMLPKEWNSVLETLRTRSSNLVVSAWDSAVKIAKPQQVRDNEPLPEMSLSEWLELSPEERDQRLLATCDDDPIANIRHTAHVLTRDQWKREAVEILPAGVFVWRDDFEQAFHRVYARLLMIDEKPGDREMNLSPWMPEESRRAVMDGFAVGSPQHQVQGQLAEDASETVPAPKQAKKAGRKPGKHKEHLTAILDALDSWAGNRIDFDRKAMPGPLGTSADDEGSFHWFCAKLYPHDFRKTKRAFEEHRTGVCAIAAYAQSTDFYRQALPHIAQKLEVVLNASRLPAKGRRAA